MEYVPARGHTIWLDVQPRTGHEQAGRRPALVLSHHAYNRRVGLALACPITRQVKGYPFEVVLPEGLEVEGAVLVDQIRSIDWRARRAEFLTRVPEQLVRQAASKIRALLEGEA